VFAVPLALLLVVAPTLLRLALDPYVTGTTFAAYYPFVLATAVLLRPCIALGVALGSTLIANFLFMAPRHTLFATAGDTLGALLFIASTGLLILLCDALRKGVWEIEARRKREAELNSELQHLNAELAHRVRNILTVVQGLAAQTFRSTAIDDESVRTFRGRLQALAHAQDVLTSGRSDGCGLPDLAARALAPFNALGALNIAGPPCTLPEHSCMPLVLALHELATNAVKYGALSSLQGVVDVTWDLRRPEGGGLQFVLQWTESGGPKVAPPTRRGLGARLLAPQRGLAEVDVDFRDEGLACRIVVEEAVAL
jgi:two-component sensor histidine kinase